MQIDVRFGSSIIQLECDNQEQIIQLAEKVNARIDQLKATNLKISDARAAFIAAMILQYELDALKTDSEQQMGEAVYNTELINHSFYETIEHVIAKVEAVTTKMQNSHTSFPT